MTALFSTAITPVSHYPSEIIPICWCWNICYYYQCWKQLCCL